jgi:hypothetical protein
LHGDIRPAGRCECVPQQVVHEFKKISFWEHYEIDYEVNPFYLRADFDGDSKPDFAVLCIRKSDKSRFVAVALSKKRKPVFVPLDPEKQIDGWEVFSKAIVKLPENDGAKVPPKLFGDAILLKFGVTLLLYWDGNKFRAYALND